MSMVAHPHNTSLPDDLWQLMWSVDVTVAEVFADALEPLTENVSWMINEDTGQAEGQALRQGPFDAVAVQMAMELAAAATSQPVPTWSCVRLPPQNWVAKNQMDFPPLRMESFYIYGSHHRGQPKPLATVGLLIDAATAFGTGEHATTRGCLRALRALRRQNAACRTILDMGCGTGILAIASAQLWPSARVFGGDIEAESVRVSRVNAHRNRVHGRFKVTECQGFTTRLLRDNGPYDVIVANILAKPLCLFAADLARHLQGSPGATVILSGLLRSQMRQVANAYRSVNLVMHRWYDLDGWITLVLAPRLASAQPWGRHDPKIGPLSVVNPRMPGGVRHARVYARSSIPYSC